MAEAPLLPLAYDHPRVHDTVGSCPRHLVVRYVLEGAHHKMTIRLLNSAQLSLARLPLVERVVGHGRFTYGTDPHTLLHHLLHPAGQAGVPPLGRVVLDGEERAGCLRLCVVLDLAPIARIKPCLCRMKIQRPPARRTPLFTGSPPDPR